MRAKTIKGMFSRTAQLNGIIEYKDVCPTCESVDYKRIEHAIVAPTVNDVRVECNGCACVYWRMSNHE